MEQQTPDVLRFRPRPFTDPIWMEYILREVELEEQVRNRLLASHFETLAAVHKAYAEGATRAAKALGGLEKR